ncbi:hypothetical protein HMPREF1308_05062 [Klebsiella pneumoniae subsp. pneumoniae WGLW5]|nr:hypothetical protein HMPREF1308_05062 [Klebsiella pneumoniae subsp. pneumoniae WGLW5]
MLNTIAFRRPLPQLLKTDNASEFAGKMLDKWVYIRRQLVLPTGANYSGRIHL